MTLERTPSSLLQSGVKAHKSLGHAQSREVFFFFFGGGLCFFSLKIFSLPCFLNYSLFGSMFLKPNPSFWPSDG